MIDLAQVKQDAAEAEKQLKDLADRLKLDFRNKHKGLSLNVLVNDNHTPGADNAEARCYPIIDK